MEDGALRTLKDHAKDRWNGVGARKYGPFDPRTDRRCLVSELGDEAADIPNYCTSIRLWLSVRGRLTWTRRLRLLIAHLGAAITWRAMGDPRRWPEELTHDGRARRTLRELERPPGWPS